MCLNKIHYIFLHYMYFLFALKIRIENFSFSVAWQFTKLIIVMDFVILFLFCL